MFKIITSEKYILMTVYAIFLLLPWYYNFSGQVQPVDIFIVIALLIFSVNYEYFNFKSLMQSKIYIFLLTLLAYTTIRVSFVHFHNDTGRMLREMSVNLYYIALTTLSVSILLHFYYSRTKQQFYEVILNCLLITTVIPLATLILFGPNYGLEKLQLIDPTAVRPMLTFNNPNQLGFFAFVNLSLFFYLALMMKDQEIIIKKWISLFIININLIFLILSVSRAAAPAFFLYLSSYFLIFRFTVMKKYHRAFYIVMTIICLILIGEMCLYHHQILLKTNSNSAINFGVFNDFYIRAIQGISYNFKNTYLLFFGNGTDTNPLRDSSLEFHNNFSHIFNQTGLVGLLIYLSMTLAILFGLFKRGFLYVFPFLCYLCYSNMHYAFRTRMNWLFFAVIIFLLIIHATNTSTKKSANKNGMLQTDTN